MERKLTPNDASPSASSPPWIMGSAPGPQTVLNGRTMLYFAGTGYLGLQAHPALVAAAQAALAEYGVHTATTRRGFGTSPPVAEVERRAARLLGCEDACYLVSGYAGNFAIAATLTDQVRLVLIDEAAHDCLREATRWLDQLVRPPVVFRHRDAGHLAELLAANRENAVASLVLTDGIFPSSGNLAPLPEYLDVLRKYPGAMLLVDDAHGIAVLGEHGRGSLEHAGVQPENVNTLEDHATRVFLSATLSKGVGGHGGVVAGSRAFLERLRKGSGWYGAASAPAAPVAAATAKGLEIIEAAPVLRARLAANVARLQGALGPLGLKVEASPSPIIGLTLDTAAQMQSVHSKLLDEGIAIAYARDYAGIGPDGMLRIAVFATHTDEMIDRLVDALRRAL